jgi:hypothetical protein
MTVMDARSLQADAALAPFTAKTDTPPTAACFVAARRS